MEYRSNHFIWKNSFAEWEERKKFPENRRKLNLIGPKKILDCGKMRLWSSFFYKCSSVIKTKDLAQKTILQVLKKIFKNFKGCPEYFQDKNLPQKNIFEVFLLKNCLFLHNRSFFKFKSYPCYLISNLFYGALTRNKIGTIIDNVILCPLCKKMDTQREVWNLSVAFILEEGGGGPVSQSFVKISSMYFCKYCFYKVFSYQKSFFHSLPLLNYGKTFCFLSFRNLLSRDFHRPSYSFQNFEKLINLNYLNKKKIGCIKLSFSDTKCLYYSLFLKSNYSENSPSRFSKTKNFSMENSNLLHQKEPFGYIYGKDIGSILLNKTFEKENSKKFIKNLISREKIRETKLAYYYFFKLEDNHPKNIYKTFL